MGRGRVAYEATISSQLVSHVMEEAFTRTATYQKVIHSMITKYVLQDQTLTRQAICTLKPGQSGQRFAQEMFERLTIPCQFTFPHIFHFIGFRFVSRNPASGNDRARRDCSAIWESKQF